MRAYKYVSLIFFCLASAFTLNSHAEPAIIFKGELCFLALIPPDADPIPLQGEKLQAIAAVSGNNTTPLAPGKFTCQGYHSYPVEYALAQKGSCYIPGTPLGDLFTEDGFAVFTPEGTFTAQCRFPKDTSPQN